MPEFLTTRNISASITDILRKADEKIGLVSPYIRFADEIAQRLRDADRAGKTILVVYGKEELRDDTREVLSGLENLHLYYSENLHAKCYFNERKLVLTSMNLYEFSEMNNREMGIEAESDEQVYEDTKREVGSIILSAEEEPLGRSSSLDFETFFDLDIARDVAPGNGRDTGHCIRCGETIPHDPDRPFCGDCFKEWVKWKNEDYEEKYCHTCGEPNETSKSRPECKSCWSKARQYS